MIYTFFSALVFILASSASTLAADFSFTYFGNNNGNYSMVSCDYAESQAAELFEIFGVKRADIYCSGGILPSGMLVPLSLNVKYSPVNPGTSPLLRKEIFESSPFGSNACDFNTRLVRALVPQVKNVRIIRSQSACFNSQSAFSYEFEVKLPR
jgi:hypothetical protein